MCVCVLCFCFVKVKFVFFSNITSFVYLRACYVFFFFLNRKETTTKKTYQPNPHACSMPCFSSGLAELCLWSQPVVRRPGFLGGDWEVTAFWASGAPGTDRPGDSNVMGQRSHLPGCVAEPRWRPYSCPSHRGVTVPVRRRAPSPRGFGCGMAPRGVMGVGPAAASPGSRRTPAVERGGPRLRVRCHRGPAPGPVRLPRAVPSGRCAVNTCLTWDL